MLLLVIKLIEGKLIINIIIKRGSDNRVIIKSVIDIVFTNIYIRKNNKYGDHTVRSKNIFNNYYYFSNV